MAVNHWVRGSNPRGGVQAVREGGFFNALLCFIMLCNSLQDKELAAPLGDTDTLFLPLAYFFMFLYLVLFFTMFYTFF